MTLAAQVKFGLEELTGIDSGLKRKGIIKDSLLEKLIEAQKKCDDSYLRLGYNEQDITELVEYAGMQEYDDKESEKCGEYIGRLITNLTKENEKLGKRTIIEIPENHLDCLGLYCRKFDIVKIGVNYGNDVFRGAKKGNLLYVERCERDNFAYFAGCDGGNIRIIAAKEVNGKGFADFAGSRGNVDVIAAKEVNGVWFAWSAGEKGGNAGMIVAKEVNGGRFAEFGGFKGNVGIIAAKEVNGNEFANNTGDEGYVRIIAAEMVNGNDFAAGAKSVEHIYKCGEKAAEVYVNAMKKARDELAKYNIDWGLKFKKIKIIKKIKETAFFKKEGKLPRKIILPQR
ncbi:MAG: hypothetical protein PHC66_04965 [Candidatus Nanoarchaeia archaeon]|nr:hypothetical protein [Candidatus Nanoarchaeia archaeon]MDD5238897.1 hypothetical protein [Candidatus Nanoarchaeia archaeon]